jgi:hypothetical protein
MLVVAKMGKLTAMALDAWIGDDVGREGCTKFSEKLERCRMLLQTPRYSRC